MPYLSNCTLTTKRDSAKKLIAVTAKATVNFSTLERSFMSLFPAERYYRLKCKLYGEDGWLDQDNVLYVFTDAFYFPDGTVPDGTERRTFEVTLGEGVLDEDLGRDEVYARFSIYSYLASRTVSRMDTETVHLRL